MRKFKIFLFIEACLLTGALILMVSEHFSRFLLILFLFLLLIRYYTGKEGNNLLFGGGNHSLLFHRHAQSFCDSSYFCWGHLQPLSSLSDDEPGKEQTNLVFEEVVTVKKEKKSLVWQSPIIFQATRLASLMISISFVLWARTPFIWRG